MAELEIIRYCAFITIYSTVSEVIYSHISISDAMLSASPYRRNSFAVTTEYTSRVNRELERNFMRDICISDYFPDGANMLNDISQSRRILSINSFLWVFFLFIFDSSRMLPHFDYAFRVFVQLAVFAVSHSRYHMLLLTPSMANSLVCSFRHK